MFDDTEFEGRLLEVDWPACARAGFGSVPKSVLGLIRAQPGGREDWHHRLELSLLPQASLGKCAPDAVPFLLELVRARVAADEIYDVLRHMLICTEEDNSGLARECRERLRSGLDVYLRDLADNTMPISVRSSGLAMAYRFEEERAIWEPVVTAVYEAESDPAFRAEIREWMDD